MRIERIENCEGWRPYAMGVLSCGHHVGIDTLPDVVACWDCGHQYDRGPNACPKCGCGSARPHLMRNAHRPEDCVQHVGDEVACPMCAEIARAVEVIGSLDREQYMHSRYRMWCGVGQYYIYRRDTSSPSGVMLWHTVPACADVDRAMQAARLSAPLSPTEGL